MPQIIKSSLPQEILNRCRDMRKNATDAEYLLWQMLRDRRLLGYKFRRQYPLEGYIADFYCHDAKLVIELDGGVHADKDQAAYDKHRDESMQSIGIRVLRFWNHQVLKDTRAVLEEIVDALKNPHPHPFSQREKGV